MRHKKKLRLPERQEQQIKKQKKLSLMFGLVNLLAIATLIVSSVLPSINAEPGSLSLIDSFQPNRGTGTPGDAATSSTGELYVSYPESDQITVYSQDGQYIRTIGYSGSADGQLDNPRGLAFDSSGNLWVIDKGNDRVQKFDTGGNYLDKISSSPNFSLASSSAELGGIAIDSLDNIYLVSYNSGTLVTSLQKFDASGSHLASLVASTGAAYDIDVDSSNNIYLSGQNNIYVFDSTTGAQTDTWGGSGSGNGQFSSNRGISLGDDDNVYVADRSNNRIQKFDSSGTYLTKWGSVGSSAFYENDGEFWLLNVLTTYGDTVFTAESSKLQRFSNTGDYQAKWRLPGIGSTGTSPSPSIRTDSTGNIYTLDTATRRVQKLDSSANPVTTWEAQSYAGSSVDSLLDLAIDSSDNIYVLSTNGIIQKFDSSGTYITQWYTSELYSRAIASDSSNNIYLLTSSQTVKKYNSTGSLTDEWNYPGTGFNDANALAINSSDNIYYLSSVGQVSITNSTGTLLDQWEISLAEDVYTQEISVDSNNDVYIRTSQNQVLKYSDSGSTIGEFSSSQELGPELDAIHLDDSDNLFVTGYNGTIKSFIQAESLIFSEVTSTAGYGEYAGIKGVATDSSDNIYTTGQNTDRIQIRSSDGTLSLEFGTTGTGNGQFQNPQGIAVDGSSIYVVDSGNDRVQVFDTSGVYQSQFGTTGTGNGQFQNPQGIAVDSSGDVYVTEYGKDSIQNFNSNGVYQSTLDNPDIDLAITPLSIAINSEDCLYTNSSSYNVAVGNNSQCGVSLQYQAISGGISTNSNNDIFASRPNYIDYDFPTEVFYSGLSQLSQAPSLYFTTPTELPNAPLNEPYSIFLETDKDPATDLYFYEYSLEEDPLQNIPPGLSLNETTGELSGTPTTAGQYSFQIQAQRTDVYGSYDNRTFTLTVGDVPEPLGISITGNFTGGTQDDAYSSDLTVTLEDQDQQLPIIQEVTSGNLPPGLSLNISGSSLNLTGTPTTAGSYTFTITITDDPGSTYDKEFTVIIAEPGEEPEKPPAEEPPTTPPPTSGGGTTTPTPNRRVPRTNLGPSIPVPDPTPEETPQIEVEEESEDVPAPTSPILASEIINKDPGPWLLLALLTITGLGYLADSIWQYFSRRSTLKTVDALSLATTQTTGAESLSNQINTKLVSIKRTLSKLLYTSPDAYMALNPTYSNLQDAAARSLSLSEINQSPSVPELGRIALPVVTGITMLISALLVYRSYANIQASGVIYFLLILAVLAIAIGGAIYAFEEYQQNKILLQEQQEVAQSEPNTPDTTTILQNLEPHLNRLEQQSLSLSDPQISQELTAQINQLRNL